MRAHDTDAGADLRSPAGTFIPARGPCIIDTGVHIRLPHGYAGMIKGKSGLDVRHGIASEGVIDEGYTGPVKVKRYNHGSYPYGAMRGDRITQPATIPCGYVDFDSVEDPDDSER